MIGRAAGGFQQKPLETFRCWQDRNLPISVEVGSNIGDFLVETASVFPDQYFLGIEIDRKSVEVATTAIERHRLRNALVVEAEARAFITDEIMDCRISRHHVYFPTPHYRSIGLREPVISERLVAALWRTLSPQGTVSILVDLKSEHRRIRKLFNDRRWEQTRFDRLEDGPHAGYFVGTPGERRWSRLRETLPMRYRKSSYTGKRSATPLTT